MEAAEVAKLLQDENVVNLLRLIAGQPKQNAESGSEPAESSGRRRRRHEPAEVNVGAKAEALDMDSPRIFIRISKNTQEIFNDLVDWLSNSGMRVEDRRPKAQVLLHIMIHEFAKLSEEKRREICRPYVD